MPKTPETGGALLRRAVRRRLRLLVTGVVSLSLWQVCEALVPVAIGVIVDTAILGLSLPLLLVSLVGLGLLFTVLSFGYRFGSRLCNTAREREAHALRVEITHAALSSAELPAERAAGEVLSLASADADTAAQSFSQLGRGVASVLGMITAAVFLLIADPVTGLVVLLAVPIGLVLVALPSRSVSTRAAAQLEAVARAGSSATDLMTGLRVLKALGGEGWAARRYRADSDAAALAGIATGERTGRLAGLGALVMSLVLAIVLVVAGLRLIDGQLSIGALIGILGMTAFLTEPMRAIAEILGLFAQSHGAAGRIAALLRELAEADPRPAAAAEADPRPVRATGGESADDSVSVDPAGLRVCESDLGDGRMLSLTVPAGTLTCLVAEAGGPGQSLLSALRARSRSLDPGRMILAPHAVDLFEGTIRTNITMSSTGVVSDAPEPDQAGPDAACRPAPDAAVSVPNEVLTASGTDELLGLVAGGLDHRIQELGGNLSGGQRQRIALARALFAAPEALVLEEPTTAVDAVTEARIAAALARLRARSGATLVLTSSPAFLGVADEVVFVPADGEVLTGPHAELLHTCPDYRSVVTR